MNEKEERFFLVALILFLLWLIFKPVVRARTLAEQTDAKVSFPAFPGETGVTIWDPVSLPPGYDVYSSEVSQYFAAETPGTSGEGGGCCCQ